jgi:hypothetical protein
MRWQYYQCRDAVSQNPAAPVRCGKTLVGDQGEKGDTGATGDVGAKGLPSEGLHALTAIVVSHYKVDALLTDAFQIVNTTVESGLVYTSVECGVPAHSYVEKNEAAGFDVYARLFDPSDVAVTSTVHIFCVSPKISP